MLLGAMYENKASFFTMEMVLMAKRNLDGNLAAIAGGGGRGEKDVKAAAHDEDQDADGRQVGRHQPKGDQQLGKVLVVVQDAEDARQQEDGVCGQHVVGHGVPVVRVGEENAVDAHAVIGDEQDQDAQVENVPEAHDVQGEALLVEADQLVEHEAGAPEPKDELQAGDLRRPPGQDGQEEANQDGEGQRRQEGPIPRHPEAGQLQQGGLPRVVQHDGPPARGDGEVAVLGRQGAQEGGPVVGFGLLAAGGRKGARGRLPVQAVGGRVEGNGAVPDGLELLDHDRVGEEVLGRGPDGNLERRGPRRHQGPAFGPAAGAAGRGGRPLRPRHALERVKVVGQRVDQLAGGVLLEELQGQQLTDLGSRAAGAGVGGIQLGFLGELEAVCHEGVERRPREVLVSNLLLHRLDEELGDLGGPQLVPRKRRLGAGSHNDSDGMSQAVHRKSV
ncbi:hypothetical protein Trco_003725 [Trichoderma cornu-damae]|uniref:Uncharacterized protein n=1 Tax=Trichoderma cornu-damae TaxID=654480 RepID=A0A9P8QRQ9_9HYPO|nr:hypothetical protein Trco_003725 [Trichoderma cornu-damae]